MLPFPKRPPRPVEPSEVIHTDEIEVLRTQQRGLAARPDNRYPSERPRVFQRSLSDEDRTLLMPAKPRIASSRPPAPATPTSFRPGGHESARPPAMNLRGMMRPRLETERTIIRPSAGISGASAAWTTPKTEIQTNKAPAMMPTPYVAFKPPVPPKLPTDVMRKSPPPPAPKPADAAATAAKIGSDPKIDPPAAVITARTKLPPGNPKASKRGNLTWAAALMAGGVFIGLITAVLARGDGDAIVDATASFVDPSHAAAGARQVGNTVSAPLVNVGTKTTAKADVKKEKDKEKEKEVAASCTGEPAQPIAVNTPAPKTEPAKVQTTAATSEVVNSTRPEPPKPSPVAYAAPPQPQQVAAPPRPVAVAAIAPVSQGAPLHAVATAAPPPHRFTAQPPAPQPVAAAPAKANPPATAGRHDDFATAAAADALAKAQLEASLR